MESGVIITPAVERDLSEIRELLRDAALPLDGVDEHWRTFIAAREDGRLVGCAGAELYHSAALVRSVAVAPSHRSAGLGRQLVRQLLDRLSARGVREFYLLTTDAEAYFEKRGFTRIERDEVAPPVLASSQFRGACPTTAVCMRLLMLG